MSKDKRPVSLLEKKLNLLAEIALKKLRKSRRSAPVFLLDGKKMASLKLKYAKKKPRKVALRQRGKPKNQVDVLAFPEPAGFPAQHLRKNPIGEIYVNRGIAKSDFERARFLVVHGLLHLLGFSHDKKTDILLMEKEEKKLCRFLGIKTSF